MLRYVGLLSDAVTKTGVDVNANVNFSLIGHIIDNTVSLGNVSSLIPLNGLTSTVSSLDAILDVRKLIIEMFGDIVTITTMYGNSITYQHLVGSIATITHADALFSPLKILILKSLSSIVEGKNSLSSKIKIIRSNVRGLPPIVEIKDSLSSKIEIVKSNVRRLIVGEE
jgi:hypothetical protein